MTALTPQQISLQSEWNSVFEGAGKAIDWVDQVAENAGEVRTVSEALTRKLYKARNVARSLRRVSTTPMGIGFFGLSQAGKSHLINTLAADQSGKLRSQFGHTELNFEDHVNPQGGGAEATGVVTRLSRVAAPSPDPAFPVELRLFREIEVAIVLVNSWFEEFDHDTDNLAQFRTTKAMLDAVLPGLQQRAGTSAAPGVASEDVSALFEYVDAHWKQRTELLRTEGYWQQAIKLAPRLSVAERAELFSVLWGRLPQLTDTYRRFGEVLERLGRAETVYADLGCLVTREGQDWLRKDSVMNVNTLHLLTAPGAPLVQVRPWINGSLQGAISLSVAELTALTSELVFRLDQPPRNKIVEQVDLLDFPGYRTRSRMPSVDRLGGKDTGISNLLLRGKVAYLFERYTEAQEMNALVVCTRSNQQSDVVGVDKVLGAWIAKTQGETPTKRATHVPGLFWVFTQSDAFAKDAIDGAETGYRDAAVGLMKKTILERFGKESWMEEWAPGRAFNNTFMTRAPQFTSFTRKADGNKYLELDFDPVAKPLLDKLGEAVLQNEDFRRHVHEPEATWAAMLALNDGGMLRFSQSLESVADVNFKLHRIAAQLQDVREDLLPALERFYEAGGEAEAAKQKAVANLIVAPFIQAKGKNEGKYVIGELLAAMAAPAQALRELYLHSNFDELTQAASPVAPAVSDATPVVEVDIFGEEQAQDVAAVVQEEVPQWQSHEHLFARAAVDLWIKHLRQIPERQGLLRLLGLHQESVAALVRELVRTAERLDVPGKLGDALVKRAGRAVKLDAMVDRQVLIARLMLDDFAAWFGYLQLDPAQRPNALLGSKKSVFSYLPAQAPEGLPSLPAQAIDYSALFADDWLSSVAINTRDNTGHRKGREITPEQNEALGKVLTVFRGSAQ